ncbi:hypothetical protein C7444_102304 [Sphaerotilus hippei]|uniref:SCP domain-containing protein n=1 Tax=Sphaerotilus hippei TaxID=744406 RepID=A0A318H4Z8_9BURK|nr:CAP domain-containing protein [Sphaerotilus hippei]PXW98813.1 hypothetical protein C7444_102304 [Sphaerotilus hippei]
MADDAVAGTAAASTTSAGTTCSITGFQATMLQAINTRRATARSCGTSGSFAATTALAWNAKLFSAAAAHSGEMARLGRTEHQLTGEAALGARITAAGYGWSAVAENIASGYGSIDTVMSGWMDSAGHCANVMNPALTEVAVSCVAASDGTLYWTMDLAAPR